MTQKNVFTIIVLIWLTILLVWAVNEVTVSLNNYKSVFVQGIPGHPTPQQISTVQMDENTVWVIDASSNYIRVITRELVLRLMYLLRLLHGIVGTGDPLFSYFGMFFCFIGLQISYLVIPEGKKVFF